MSTGRDLASMSNAELLIRIAAWREAARSADPLLWFAAHGGVPAALYLQALDQLEAEVRTSMMMRSAAA
jgi:hypothetical protein